MINKQEFFDILDKIIDKGAIKYIEDQEKEITKQLKWFKNNKEQEDIIYKKTHKIFDINNINNYEIDYPSKINIHIYLKDITNEMHNITISTKSIILNNKQELLYYINLYIERTENSYKYLQSSLSNNWIITKINLIIYDTKYINIKPKNIKMGLNKYNIYKQYCLYIQYLYHLYINIIQSNKKLLSYNKFNFNTYLKYMNKIQEILNLKPHKYKSLIIYQIKNKIIIYQRKINLLVIYYKIFWISHNNKFKIWIHK